MVTLVARLPRLLMVTRLVLRSASVGVMFGSKELL